MSKWIDADAFIDDLYEHEFSNWCDKDEVSTLVNDAPSIDIVRCKECKWVRYCETEDLDLYLDCDKPDGGGIPRSEDWFCADGEREGE